MLRNLCLTGALLLTIVPHIAQAFGGTPFVQPYRSCQTINSEKICANVAISGATEPGVYFPDIAACEDVRTQRPFWPAPIVNQPDPDDPRLNDPEFMQELRWVSQQIRSTGCICCHDSSLDRGMARWDVNTDLIWPDQLSDRGIAILSGDVPSASAGVFPPAENFGFNRSQTGIPTTDPGRMEDFFKKELARRQVTQEDIQHFANFGGPVMQRARDQVPTLCTENQGINAIDQVLWTGGPARYVYILPALAPNPLVPPDSDTPDDTLWRLNVDHQAAAIESGIALGETPSGTYQAIPQDPNRRPQLTPGVVYRLYVLKDVLQPLTNCFFEY
jgi:hypothetical protein